jgi:DNA-binding NarL/FixJ family response regulator
MTRMGRSVLVVDDDASFRNITTRILESWGFDVVGQAGSVDEAMARTAELRPDTVLVDIGLPDGNGFDLTRQLMALPWSLRVLLISSDSDIANGAAARRVGASGFFPKDELVGVMFRNAMEGA